MSDDPPAMLDDDLWTGLRRLTAARIGLKRAGASLATGPLLDFKFAHARARDAVHEALDQPRLVADLSTLDAPVLEVASAAGDRQSYLMRPDLGRRLSAGAEAMLAAHAGRYDIAFVVTRWPVGASRANARDAGSGRSAARAADRRLAHRAAGDRYPGTRRDRRRGGRDSGRRLRGPPDRRTARADARPTAWAPT